MNDRTPSGEPAEFGELYDSLLASMAADERDHVSEVVARYRDADIAETKSRTTQRHPTANDD